MRHGFLTLVLLLLGSASSAQDDLLACVDPDVRRGLLYGMANPGAIVVSRAVPDMLSGLPEIDDLEFIGSSVSELHTVAAYKTHLAAADAMNAVSGILQEAGWRNLETPGPPSGGFITGAQPRFDTFCREGTMLSAVVSPSDDSTFVRLQLNPGAGRICDELPGVPGGGIVRGIGGPNLYEYMPVLALPDGTTPLEPRMGLVLGFGGVSSSDRSASTEIELETELSARELVEQFGQQLEEQGWSYDTEWSGRYSTGSGWTRSPNDGLELVGLLDVTALSGSGYRATFRLSSRESE